MENYQGVNRCEAIANESDWLEVSYTKRNYIEEEKASESAQNRVYKSKPRIPKFVKYIAVALAVITIIVGMIIVDANVDGNIFSTAKSVFTSTLFNGQTPSVASSKVTLPSTAVISNVSSDGTVSLSGGKVATALTTGKVINTTATTVTVQVSDKVKMIYSALTSVLVKEGDELTQYQAIGKYNETTKVNVLYCDELVTKIVGSDYSFEWSV